MNTYDEQVKEFCEKCDEINKCKFIMATTKIKDLLKCIVNNPDLYALFDKVSKNFDYTTAKRECLATEREGMIVKNTLALPEDPSNRLAFIFCLLYEFDTGSLNFNTFLQTYFAEDGSYFASYRKFCQSIMAELQSLVKQSFAVEGGKNAQSSAITASAAEGVVELINAESERLFKCGLSTSEREGGLKILDELKRAVSCGDEKLIDALICGYNYFLMFNRVVDSSLAELISAITEFEALL